MAEIIYLYNQMRNLLHWRYSMFSFKEINLPDTACAKNNGSLTCLIPAISKNNI